MEVVENKSVTIEKTCRNAVTTRFASYISSVISFI